MTAIIVHGTCQAYERHGCRCGECRDGHNDRVRRNRADRLARLKADPGNPGHGTRSGYDAGCRCGQCGAARTEAGGREYDARVHYAPDGRAAPACLPFEQPEGRAVTAIAGDVTCGHCWKTRAWRDSAMAAALDGQTAGGTS